MSARSDNARGIEGISVEEFLFYLAFSIYFFLSGFQRTEYFSEVSNVVESLKILLQISIIGLLLLKGVIQKVRVERWVIALLLTAVGFLTWKFSGTAWLFWAVIFVVFGYGIDIQKLSYVVFGSALVLLLITVGGSVMGVINNTVFVRGGVLRYGMGFIHPNYLGLFCSVLCASFSVAKFGKPLYLDYLLLFISICFVLFFCDSRTSALLMLIQAVLLAVFSLCKTSKSRKAARAAFLFVFVFLVIVSVYFMAFFNAGNPIHAAINNLLSGRLYFMHGYFCLKPFSLFGCSYEGFVPIYWENGQSQTFVVDNGYCHLFLHFGVIAFTVFIAAYFFVLCDLSRMKSWDYRLFLLTLMAVYSFTETVGLQIETNYALLVLSTYLFEKPRNKSVVSKMTMEMG